MSSSGLRVSQVCAECTTSEEQSSLHRSTDVLLRRDSLADSGRSVLALISRRDADSEPGEASISRRDSLTFEHIARADSLDVPSSASPTATAASVADAAQDGPAFGRRASGGILRGNPLRRAGASSPRMGALRRVHTRNSTVSTGVSVVTRGHASRIHTSNGGGVSDDAGGSLSDSVSNAHTSDGSQGDVPRVSSLTTSGGLQMSPPRRRRRVQLLGPASANGSLYCEHASDAMAISMRDAGSTVASPFGSPVGSPVQRMGSPRVRRSRASVYSGRPSVTFSPKQVNGVPVGGSGVGVSRFSLFGSEGRGNLQKLAKAKLKAAYCEEEAKEYTAVQKLRAIFDPTAPMPSKRIAQASTAVAFTMLLLILLSVVLICVESLPQYHEEMSEKGVDNWFFVVDTFVTIIFTVDFVVRAATDEGWATLEFLKDGINWVDFLSIAPYYLHLALHTASAEYVAVIRLFRTVRVLRVMKLGRYSKPLQIVIFTLKNSIMALGLLIFFLSLATLLFSCLLFIAETHDGGQEFDDTTRTWIRQDGTPSPFQSIFHVMWWCMATLSTVGYGDEYPVTGWGKSVAAFAIISGFFVVAFPIALISNTFAEVMGEVNAMEAHSETASPRAPHDAYSLHDHTSEGGLSDGVIWNPHRHSPPQGYPHPHPLPPQGGVPEPREARPSSAGHRRAATASSSTHSPCASATTLPSVHQSLDLPPGDVVLGPLNGSSSDLFLQGGAGRRTRWAAAVTAGGGPSGPTQGKGAKKRRRRKRKAKGVPRSGFSLPPSGSDAAAAGAAVHRESRHAVERLEQRRPEPLGALLGSGEGGEGVPPAQPSQPSQPPQPAQPHQAGTPLEECGRRGSVSLGSAACRNPLPLTVTPEAAEVLLDRAGCGGAAVGPAHPWYGEAVFHFFYSLEAAWGVPDRAPALSSRLSRSASWGGGGGGGAVRWGGAEPLSHRVAVVPGLGSPELSCDSSPPSSASSLPMQLAGPSGRGGGGGGGGGGVDPRGEARRGELSLAAVVSGVSQHGDGVCCDVFSLEYPPVLAAAPAPGGGGSGSAFFAIKGCVSEGVARRLSGGVLPGGVCRVAQVAVLLDHPCVQQQAVAQVDPALRRCFRVAVQRVQQLRVEAVGLAAGCCLVDPVWHNPAGSVVVTVLLPLSVCDSEGDAVAALQSTTLRAVCTMHPVMAPVGEAFLASVEAACALGVLDPSEAEERRLRTHTSYAVKPVTSDIPLGQAPLPLCP